MRALAKRLGWFLLGVLGVLLAVTGLTARSGDPALWPPAPGAPAVEIHLVSHGYHSGIVLPREALSRLADERGRPALIAVGQRFAAYPFVEVGWGDEGFYRSVPDAASLTVTLALRALFMPGNASVVHVVGLARPARETFPASEIIRIELSEEGFARLLSLLDTSFTRGSMGRPEELGPGLYGPSLFYRGVETFHLFNVCNHWVARLLSAAGLPTAPVPAILPAGLFLDLKWRAGLVPLPKS
jgi:uncharacterized protein (TIGR02117 family)